MTYIINPMWFYWLSVADAVCTISIVLLAFSSVAMVIGGIMYLSNAGWGEDNIDYRIGKRLFKTALPICIVAVLLVVFLPSKDTLIEMQVARYATVENAEMSLDAIKAAADYILNAIKEMKA